MIKTFSIFLFTFLGIQLLAFIPYNFSWTMNLTFEELTIQTYNFRGTALPNFGVIFITFGYTSSVYHLMYIGMQRMYAITKPISYRLQDKLKVIAALLIVWILSLISSTTTCKYFYWLNFITCLRVYFEQENTKFDFDVPVTKK